MKPIIPLHIAPFILAILLLIAGCSDKLDPHLLSAERDMDLNPDSILTTLESLDTTEFNSHNLALYKLLHTQALDKTDRLPANFNEISDALDYFSKHGNDREKMMANFYQGQTEYIGKDYEQAMRHAFEAYQYSLKVDKPYWIAKTAEFVADICSENYIYDEALKYREIAVDNYKHSNEYGNYEFALIDYGHNLICNEQYNRGIGICDSIFRVAVKRDEPSLIVYSLRYLLDGYMSKNDIDRAKELLPYLKRFPESELPDYSKTLLAQIYRNENKPDSAIFYLNLCSDGNIPWNVKAGKLLEYKQISYQKGDTEAALHYSDSIIELQNSVFAILMQQPSMRAQTAYYSELTLVQKNNVHLRTLLLILCCSLFAIILFSGFIIYKIKMKAKKNEMEELLTEIVLLKRNIISLKEQSEEKDSSSSFHLAELSSIFQSQLDTIGLLAKEYFDRWESPSSRTSILAKIEEMIEDWKRGDKKQEIELALNLYSNNAVKRFREQMPQIKEEDITFIIYLWSGLPPKAVALFCGLKSKTYYSKKTRLIEKIEKSSAPDKEEFLIKMRES